MFCPIPYVPPLPSKASWSFVTSVEKRVSPQMSATLTALAERYGTLDAAVKDGWRFVNPDVASVIERVTRTLPLVTVTSTPLP